MFNVNLHYLLDNMCEYIENIDSFINNQDLILCYNSSFNHLFNKYTNYGLDFYVSKKDRVNINNI